MVTWVSMPPGWGKGARRGSSWEYASQLQQEPALVPMEAGVVREEKAYDSGPVFCAPLNSGAFLLWWPELPSPAFPVAELLIPIPSDCLLTANSSPFPRSAHQTPRSSTYALSALADTCLRLGHAELWLQPV